MAVARANKDLSQVLKKIPLFIGLSPTHIRAILSISSLKTFEPREQICQADEESANEVFVLMGGELAVTTRDGVRVATVTPITTVGEIALIARQRWSATVQAIQASQILVIPRPQFDLLMRRDKDLQISIFRNVIEILFTKLTNDNVRMRDHLLDKVRRETRVKDSRRRMELAIGLLDEKGVMAKEEARAYIDERIGEMSMQVLIVDDEEAIRKIVVEALPNFEVLEAGDGEEALELIKERQPDLVVADIKMPQMDGCTLLTHLREQFPDLPVLGLSGLVDIDEIQNHSFDGFIEKPIKLEEFKQLVEETLVKEEEEV